MTAYLLDVASYQGDLALADVRRAGFDAVNLKISHGLGERSVHPSLAEYVAEAREIGLGISTFHYLTGEATGAAQATYAYKRLLELSLVDGTAHQVDVESTVSPPTWQIIADYVATMQALLGRPIVIYSAGWWWTASGRGWDGSVLTSYLWAAPNPGYPGSYPGDTSPLWQAGYGGWPALAVMQYAVEPLTFPDGTTGMIKVSKSAIRDPQVWAALTGGGGMGWVLTAGLQNLRGQVNWRWPSRDKTSDGTIGDTAHQAEISDHNPDDTAGSTPGWDSDSDSTAEVRAWDCDTDFRESGMTAQQLVDHIRYLPNIGSVLRYMIYNRKMYHVRDGFAPTDYTGPSAHTEHVHFSGAYTQASDNNTTFDFKLLEVGMAEVDLTDAAVQKLASKIGVDLNNAASGIGSGTIARSRDAYSQFWSDAYHASMAATPAGDATYAAADAGAQQRMRYARDIVRGAVGGPVNQADILDAINVADQISDADKQAIAAAVLSGMDYRGIADAVVAAMPQDQVQSLLDALAARLQS